MELSEQIRKRVEALEPPQFTRLVNKLGLDPSVFGDQISRAQRADLLASQLDAAGRVEDDLRGSLDALFPQAGAIPPKPKPGGFTCQCAWDDQRVQIVTRAALKLAGLEP